jgi:S1-C subfamily serine protease
MRASSGALVRAVSAGSPAAEAGVRTGDVIVKLDNDEVGTVEDLYAALRKVKPGDRVTIVVDRAGAEARLTATAGTLSR